MISASATSSPTINYSVPFLQLDDKIEEIAEISYGIEKPKNSASAKIYDLIVDASKKYGLDANTALKIAKCESGFNQFNENGEIVRGIVNSKDAGVFQINEGYHLNRSQALDMDIHTTKGNIEYAMWLMKKEGVKHWNWSKPCWGNEENKIAQK